MNVFALCLFLLIPGVPFWLDALATNASGTALGAAVLSVLLALLVWNAKSREI